MFFNGGVNRKAVSPDELVSEPIVSSLSGRDVLSLSAKLNFKRVGGRLGKYTNKVAKIISNLTSEEIYAWKNSDYIKFTVDDDDELTYEIVNPENEMQCEK